MNWAVFAMFTYVALALQMGLASALQIDSRFGAVEPRFVLILAVLIALCASARTTLIAWAVLGALLDLLCTHALAESRGLTLIGPYALGYLGGGFVALQVRAGILRYHPLAFAFMVLICGAAVHLIVVGVFALRGMLYPDMPGWSGGTELLLRLCSLAYTAALGALLAIPLLKTSGLFAFHNAKFRHRG